jgi:hypothetical protein
MDRSIHKYPFVYPSIYLSNDLVIYPYVSIHIYVCVCLRVRVYVSLYTQATPAAMPRLVGRVRCWERLRRTWTANRAGYSRGLFVLAPRGKLTTAPTGRRSLRCGPRCAHPLRPTRGCSRVLAGTRAQPIRSALQRGASARPRRPMRRHGCRSVGGRSL